MRKDRRSPQQIFDLLNRSVKVRLTSWEKRNVKKLYKELCGIDFPKKDENCGSCYRRAIESVCKEQKRQGIVDEPLPAKTNIPTLVKSEKMVKPEPEKEVVEEEAPKKESKSKKDKDYDSMSYPELLKCLPTGYKGSRKKVDVIAFLKG